MKKGQRSNDLTGWINYFQEVIMASPQEALEQIKFLLKRPNTWIFLAPRGMNGKEK
jgi:hypothetical protein